MNGNNMNTNMLNNPEKINYHYNYKRDASEQQRCKKRQIQTPKETHTT